MAGFVLDIAGLQKQLESVKKRIELGAIEGFKDAREYLESIMKFYIEERVYSSKIYTPKVYHRTGDLKNNVTAKIIGNTIYVFVDDTGMDRTQDGVTYPHRVLEGHNVHPYEHVPKDGSWAGYMDSRNWVEATRMEFVNHMNQSQDFLEIVKRAIQRRI